VWRFLIGRLGGRDERLIIGDSSAVYSSSGEVKKEEARNHWGVGACGRVVGLSTVPPSCLQAKRGRVASTVFEAVIWPRPRCPRIVPARARRGH
jgi:hypothetical protein